MQWYRVFGVLVGTFLFFESGSLADQTEAPSWLLKEIQAYAHEYEKVRDPHRPGRGIEVLYRKGVAAGKALLSQKSERLRLVESLDQGQMEAVRRALPGLFINREEVLVAVPDPEQFLKFAIELGDRADIAFFSILTMSYSSPGWPIYIEQQTDYGGCRRLGSFVFSELYERWRRFRGRFPDRYKEEVRQEIASLEEAILHTGSCEGPGEVLEAYHEFLRAFPDASIAKEIQLRVNAIEKGESNLRFDRSPR